MSAVTTAEKWLKGCPNLVAGEAPKVAGALLWSVLDNYAAVGGEPGVIGKFWQSLMP